MALQVQAAPPWHPCCHGCITRPRPTTLPSQHQPCLYKERLPRGQTSQSEARAGEKKDCQGLKLGGGRSRTVSRVMQRAMFVANILLWLAYGCSSVPVAPSPSARPQGPWATPSPAGKRERPEGRAVIKVAEDVGRHQDQAPWRREAGRLPATTGTWGCCLGRGSARGQAGRCSTGSRGEGGSSSM